MTEERAVNNACSKHAVWMRLTDLDRDKLDVEPKLNDVRMAMDGYSEGLKNKV